MLSNLVPRLPDLVSMQHRTAGNRAWGQGYRLALYPDPPPSLLTLHAETLNSWEEPGTRLATH